MPMLKKFAAGLKSLFRKKQMEHELDEELHGFVESSAQQKMRAGIPREQALREARIEMGSTAAVKDRVHEAGWESLLEGVWQDLRYGARALRKNPGFTIVSVLTLAMGVGINTSIFTVVNGVLLNPLPYPHSDRLYSVQENGGYFGNPTSYLNAADWRSQNHVFSGLATYHGDYFTLTGTGEPAHLWGAVVSSEFVSVLEVPPLLGRAFEPQDEKPGARVVLLSHALWQERYHSNPAIVGQGITLNQQSFTVIGVMPPGFRFPTGAPAQLWVSTAADPDEPKTRRGYMWLNTIARLKPGVAPAQAQADLDVIAKRLAQQYPKSNSRYTSVRMVSQLDRVVGSSRLPLLILLGVVAGVLLIACANLANLSLARNLQRQKETAVRAALGAGRRRLITQLLAESVLLAMMGGVSGVLLATWSTPALLRLVPDVIPRAQDIGLDGRVLAFAVLLSALTALLFGLLPAYQSSRTDLVNFLNDARQTASTSRPQRRVRNLLVTVESALAVILLTGAGLLISSYLKLLHADPGLDPRGLITFDFDLPSYTPDQSIAFYNRLLSSLERLPQVKSAVAAWQPPFSGGAPGSGISIEGRTFPPGHNPIVRIRLVTPGYFHTVGMQLKRGRDFTEHDSLTSNQVVIVDEAFAQTYFPNEDPIGKHIQPSMAMGPGLVSREIVGVVNSTKLVDLVEDFQPQYYIPYAQLPGPQPSVLVKVDGDPMAIAPAIRSIMASMDRNVPIYDLGTINELVSSTTAQDRFNTLLFGLFAALALILAAIGIYGVISYTVGQSTHEIGIRMALGAQNADVIRHTITTSLGYVLAGLAIGVLSALALSRLIADLLYKVGTSDPLTLAAVCLLFLLVALIACYIPARRATKVDPLIALRSE